MADALADLPGAGGAADGSSDKMKDVSYCIGFGAGMNMARQDLGLVPAEFIEGFQAGFAGSGARMTEAEMQDVMTSFEREMMSKQNEMMAGQGAEAQEAGDSFLAENKTKEGVVTTDSGLQYKVVKPGEGKQPTRNDTVSVDYRGTLLDGTVFDSSYDRGQPAEFQVGRVIAGWTEALLLMKEGCEWELYIPSKLAYGPQGMPGSPIGPNETLIFKVELRKINAAPGSEPPPSDPPAEEKPAADPPAEEKPAADPPAAEKPAADPPAEEKPAADPPAEEAPAKETADPPAEGAEK